MNKHPDILLTLYRRPSTVFTVGEIAQLLPHIPVKRLRDRLYYFNSVGKITRLKQGIYAKIDYNPLEVANRVYTPSYISLETVLAKGGVVFQYYETIFAVSYLTRSIRVGAIPIQYRHIKGEILTNTKGIEEKAGYWIASVERAFLDAVYIYKNYHFDNLGMLDWEKIADLKTLYGSRVFEKRIAEYYLLYKEEYGKRRTAQK